MSQIHSFLGVKMASFVKILGKWSKNFCSKKVEKLFHGVYMDEFDQKSPYRGLNGQNMHFF